MIFQSINELVTKKSEKSKKILKRDDIELSVCYTTIVQKHS